jgi:diaminopimelate epimerase
MKLIKAHALGNDFLLLDAGELPPSADSSAVARAVCDRHRGVGADGLLIFSRRDDPVSMRLLNADGSPSEISGNGLRCLAAWLAHTGAAGEIVVDTGAGRKRLQRLVGPDDPLNESALVASAFRRKSDAGGSLPPKGGSHPVAHRYTFTAAMGEPEQIALERIDVGGVQVEAVTLRVGNPQCVVLGDVSLERLHTLASALAVHPRFPEGTNVELATVETPAHVRILIWERGVGPTEASGTGACASAVAAIRYGGASREVDIESPGGTQHVAWRSDGLHLTGWAEIVATVEWLGA